MRGESEVLCGHSHGQSVELGQVQDGDVVSELLLHSVELQVAERTDVDLGDVSEGGLESSSGSAAQHLLLPGHALGTGGLDELVEDLGVLGVVDALDVAGLQEVASVECGDLVGQGVGDLGLDSLDSDLKW